MPARCVVLRVQCPGPLGSCSPVCPLGVLCCICRVLGHLAPVHQCARSVLCFASAVWWGTWLLFTAVPVLCVTLPVHCPGPRGSRSPVRPLGGLCCPCGVLRHSAPVHRRAHSASCVACTLSWAAWLLFTGVVPRCAVLWVAHALWRVGASLWGAHSSIRTAAVRSRQGLGTLRARTRPSGRGLFVAGRSWVHSRRALVHPDGGWCCLAPVPVPWFVACCAPFPGLRPLAAVVAWHLSVRTGCGRRRTSLACLMGPRGALRLVRSGRSRCSGRLSRRRGSFHQARGYRPRLYWVAARGTRRPAENRAPCACRWPPQRQGRWACSALYPFGAPRWGCPWRVPPASVLDCVPCGVLVCVDPVTDASGFPCRSSFDGGLGRCTGAVSCGRQYLPLRVGGRHAQVPCVCACARPSWPGRAGRPPGRVLVRLTFSCSRFVFLLCSAPSGLGLPLSWSFFLLLLPLFFSPLSLCVLLSLVSGPGCLGPWRLVFLSSLPPGLCFFFFSSFPLRTRCLRLSFVSGPGCPGPWRCLLFVLLAFGFSALRAL